MVNLRSRTIPEKSAEANVEVRTPRLRRGSSVQAESPSRARSVSVESERRGTPRSQRKSSRLNSPLVLSKTVKSNLFGGGSEEGMTRPATIIEEKSESPGKVRDRTLSLSEKADYGKEDIETKSGESSPVVLLQDIKCNLFGGDSGESKRSASPNKEKRRSLVKGRERKISDYFVSGKEDDKTKSDASSIIRLKDIYAGTLQAIDTGEVKRRLASPNKERRGSLVKIKAWKISDFVNSGNEDSETDSDTSGVLSKDVKSSLTTDDFGEGKRSVLANKDKSESPLKGRGRKRSDGSGSGKEDAKTQSESSPSRSTSKNDPRPGIVSPRISTKSWSDPTSVISDNQGGKTEGMSPTCLKEKSPALEKRLAKKLSRKSDSAKEDAKKNSESSPSRSTSKNDPQTGIRSSRITKSGSDPTSVCSDNQERKTEGVSPKLQTHEKSQTLEKVLAKRLSRKSDSGTEDDKTKSERTPSRSTSKNDPQTGIRSSRITKSGSDPTSVCSDNQERKTEGVSPKLQTHEKSQTLEKVLAKRLSRKSDSGTEDAKTKSERTLSRSTSKNDPQTGIRSPRITKSGADPTSVCSDNQEGKTEGVSPTRLKERSQTPEKILAKRLSRKSDSGGGTVSNDDEEVVKDAQVTNQSPRRRTISGPESLRVGIPKEVKSPRMKDKSLSPDKGRVRRASVTSLSKDDTPSEVTPNSTRKPKKSGSDRLSAADESSKTDDVSMGSPEPDGRTNVLAQKDEVDQSVVKKKVVLQKEMFPVKTQSNKTPKKISNWKVSGSSDAAVEQASSSIDSSARDVDRTGESLKSQLKTVSASEVRDSNSDQTWKNPAQLKAKKISLESTRGPTNPKDGDNVAAAKNYGRAHSPIKTPKSTDVKWKDSGSEPAPESAGLLIHSSKEVVRTPVLLTEPMGMDWEPSKTPDNEGNTSVEMKDISDTKEESFSKTPKKKKNSRRRRKSGSDRLSVSSEFQVSSVGKDVSSSLPQTNSTSLENGVLTNGTEKKLGNSKEVSDGFKSPKVPSKKKGSKKRRKSGSENKQLLDDSMTKTDGVSGDKDVPGKGVSGGKDVPGKGVSGSKDVPGKGVSGSKDVPGKGVSGSKDVPGKGVSGSKDVPGKGVSGSKDVPGKGVSSDKDVPGKGVSGSKDVPGKGVSSDKDVPGKGVSGDKAGKATSKKRKKKKHRDPQMIKASEPLDDEIRTKDYSSKMGDSEVTVRRRGGGTIIESRPVFSDDAKYVYVNCGWGVRVFSIATGECVRVFDAYSKDHKVVACFCWKSCPAALTSEGLFIAWDPRSGRVQQKVRLNVQELVVDGFFFSVGPEIILCLVLETKTFTQLRVYSGTTFRSQPHPLNSRKIRHPYNLHHLSVGGNPERPFIAFLSNKNKLKIINMNNKCFRKSVVAGAKKHWTCVQCHPREETVAVGDSIGRIVVYKIASAHDNNQMIPAVYHWHTLPVSEIAFTAAGSSMYSGGGELTLVKWNLDNPHIKHYLPRLSADIVHIAISPYNQMVAIATLDNGIQIITPSNGLHCVLQQLSWSVFAGEQEGMFPAGLIYDPRSRGLMLNGRPGHLQLYSPLSETLTYNIDVTMMNYLTQERDKVIVNTHVTHSALTSDGLWLATIETRYEPGLALELKLKFWEYVVDKKRYALATVIDMPHDGKIHSIKFSPGPTGSASNEDVGPDHEVVLASTGADKKLRLWSKIPIESIYKKGSTWRCQNACFYRDRSCGPCSFSYDGSLLAVGFSSVLTLWDVDNVVLKQTIARGNEELKFVEFGRDDCCHILMCATDSNIVAWNLLTLSFVWKVETGTALFAPDPYSCFFAVFTVENQWKILDAHNGEVAYTINSDGKSEVGDQLAKSQVLAAVFAPRHRPNPDAPQWMKNSYLYYIDIYQELNCLEPANEISQLPTFQLALDKDAGTPFGSLVGAKSVREATDEELTKQAVGYGVLGSQTVTQLLRPPAHTLPPVSLLCGSFLQSFVIMKRDAPHESDHEDKSEDDKTTVVASSDSEGEAKKSAKSEKSHKLRKKRLNKQKKTGLDRKTGSGEKTVLDEPMETESIDLRKHFPPLDEDDAAEAMFVIDD